MEEDELPWVAWLLQTADALFPTGAYAHSLGFEESVRLGVVRDEVTLATFLRTQIAPAQADQELPYLRYAYAASGLGELCVIDQEIDAWKLALEAREASAQIGGRRLAALGKISDAVELREFAHAVASGRARGHHLVVCALQARVGGIPLRAALAAYLYQSLAAVCAAAPKLIRIGQDGCQRVLRTANLEADELVRRSLAVARGDAGWFNPLLEIAAMRHARADERLFIS